jgi:hypothetical protein
LVGAKIRKIPAYAKYEDEVVVPEAQVETKKRTYANLCIELLAKLALERVGKRLT